MLFSLRQVAHDEIAVVGKTERFPWHLIGFSNDGTFFRYTGVNQPEFFSNDGLTTMKIQEFKESTR